MEGGRVGEDGEWEGEDEGIERMEETLSQYVPVQYLRVFMLAV